MPTMRDVRNIMNAKGVEFRCGTLSAPLFVLLIGKAAETEEQNLRETLAKRWSNSGDYLFVAAIRSGNQDGKNGTSYVIDSTAVERVGEQQLYWALTWIVGDFLEQSVSSSISLTGATLAAIVCGEDEKALWAIPAMAILNDMLYDGGGSVVDRSAYVYLAPYDPGNAPVLKRVRRAMDQWSQQVPEMPMRYVDYPDQSYAFIPCDGNMTGSLFDRVVCLSTQTDTGKFYDVNGGRNDLFGALIDPESGIEWPNGRVFSGFMYPDTVERGIDLVITWKQVHARFVSVMDQKGPDREQLQEIHKKLIDVLERACKDVAKGMHGFGVYNDEAMQSTIERLNREKKRQISSVDESRIFGAALKNKYDYLWRHILSSDEVSRAEQEWNDQMQAWFERIWSYSKLTTEGFQPLQYAVAGKDRGMTDPIDGTATVDTVCRAVVEAFYSPKRGENAEKIEGYIAPLRERMSAAYKKRTEYLHNLQKNDIQAFRMQIENVQSEFVNELRMWSQTPEELFKAREGVINVGSALDAAYEKAINCPEIERGLMEFLKTAAAWLVEQHYEPTAISAPVDSMKRIACHLHSKFAATPGNCERIVSGRDENRYYYVHCLTIGDEDNNVQEFGT